MYLDVIKAYMFRRHSCILARLLKTIADFTSKTGRDPYTREVLTWLKTWGYGHKILKLAEYLGIVERYEGYLIRGKAKIKVVFNRITEFGYRILDIFRELNKNDDIEEESEDDEDN